MSDNENELRRLTALYLSEENDLHMSEVTDKLVDEQITYGLSMYGCKDQLLKSLRIYRDEVIENMKSEMEEYRESNR